MASTVVSDVFTTGQAADYIGISQSTVINYIDKGLLVPDYSLPSTGNKVGRRMFYKSTLDDFIGKLKGKEN